MATGKVKPFRLQIKLEGPIAHQSRISIRKLQYILDGLQNAINRAYLYSEGKPLKKYSKIPSEAYKPTSLYVDNLESGSLIVHMVRESKAFNTLWSSLVKLIDTVYEPALAEAAKTTRMNWSVEDVDNINALINVDGVDIGEFDQELDELRTRRDKNFPRRSVLKGLDHMLQPIRSGTDKDVLTMTSQALRNRKFEFDRTRAIGIHRMVAKKKLGDPLLIRCKIREMDEDQHTGKVQRENEKARVVVKFPSEKIFEEVRRNFRRDQVVPLIVCPIMEFGAFDPDRGDLVAVRVIKDI